MIAERERWSEVAELIKAFAQRSGLGPDGPEVRDLWGRSLQPLGTGTPQPGLPDTYPSGL